MFEALIIKLLINTALDLIIEKAKEAVDQTDNDIDDQFVDVLERNKNKIAGLAKQGRRKG